MTLAHVGCLLVLGIAAFFNCFENGFHLDDGYRVERNPGVEQFWPPWRHFADPNTSAQLPRLVQYRPMLPLTLSVNYALAGGHDPVGYHVGNLLIHLLASVLLYLLVRELTTHWAAAKFSPHVPFFVAALFAVHPVSGVVVNYICSRDLGLMQLFMLGALLAYVRMRRLGDAWWRWTGVVVCLLLSLMSKKNVVALPGVLLFFELLFTKGGPERWVRLAVVCGVIGAFLGFVTFGLGFQDTSNVVADASAGEYFWHQLQHHVFHYFANFVWPLPIRFGAVDAFADWKAAVGAGVAVAAIATVAAVWRRQPLLSFSICGYILLIALTSSVVPFHDEIVAYRPYPSSAFLYLGVVVLLWRGGDALPGWRDGVCVAAIVYFAVMSVVMNPIFKDTVSINRHAVQHGGSFRAHYNLANALEDGHPDQFKHFEIALDKAPYYAVAWMGLGMAEVRRGNFDTALRHLNHAVTLVPKSGQAQYYLAQGYAHTNLPDKTQRCAAAALEATRLEPGNRLYRYYAAQQASVIQRYDKVIELLAPIHRDDPGHRHTQWLLGYAHMKRQAWPQAAAHFEQFLRYYPTGFSDVHKTLVTIYKAMGRADDVARHQKLYEKNKPR